jgi:hypothetical protein
MTKGELYDEARRLGVPGRSRMDSAQLAEAIRRAQGTSWSSNFVDRCRAGAALASRPVWAFRALLPAVADRAVSALRALPTRTLILSLVMLAAGVLGLTLAYAVAPGGDFGTQVRASPTLRIETVTGPGKTTTFVVTRTKRGRKERVPVRILRTITGRGGTQTTAVPVTGPGSTQTIAVAVAGPAVTQVRPRTETRVVTQIRPVTQVVTNVVTQAETVVVTDTVVIEVTTTVKKK